MQSAARLAVFLKVPFFRGISSEQIIALVPAVTLEYAMPGRYLIREGLDAHGLYMIARGRVQIVDRAGKQLAQRYVGEFVGEVSLLQSTPAAASCQAVDWCELLLLRRTDFQRLVARWPELLSRIQFFAAHKDNHGEMAAGAKRLKLAAQREHDASGRLEELFQRGGHELLHRGAELLTRARGISDDRSPMSRGASYGAAGGAVDGGGGGGVSGDGSGGGCGSSAAAVEASASAAEAASHAAEGEEAAAPAGGRRFTLSDPMAC